MKTEYQVRSELGGVIAAFQWTDDIQFLRENHRQPGNTLWCRQVETPEEAAVRRIKWLDSVADSSGIIETERNVSLSAYIDRKCPPPPATETQVDWDTLEPVEEVPVWQASADVWVAGKTQDVFRNADVLDAFVMLVGRKGQSPTAAIGPTREAALRNLREMQEARDAK